MVSGYLASKLNYSIVSIKRIRKLIPKFEYLKLYQYVIMSDLSYCTSCWGGIPKHVFAIQERCIILLFRNTPNFDHNLIYYINYICILMSDVGVGSSWYQAYIALESKKSSDLLRPPLTDLFIIHIF